MSARRHIASILRVAAVAGALTLSPAVRAEPEGQEHESAAEAGEHGEHGPPAIDGKKLGLQLLNFGVLVFILVKFGGGAVNKALAARHTQLKADLASASELRAAAEAKLAKQEARLGSLEAEIADMRRALKAEAEAEKALLIAAAQERAQRIKAETTFVIEQQVREAEQRLRRESADAALKAAEELLRKAMAPADQQRLLDTFIGEIAAPASPGTGRAS